MADNGPKKADNSFEVRRRKLRSSNVSEMNNIFNRRVTEKQRRRSNSNTNVGMADNAGKEKPAGAATRQRKLRAAINAARLASLKRPSAGKEAPTNEELNAELNALAAAAPPRRPRAGKKAPTQEELEAELNALTAADAAASVAAAAAPSNATNATARNNAGVPPPAAALPPPAAARSPLGERLAAYRSKGPAAAAPPAAALPAAAPPPLPAAAAAARLTNLQRRLAILRGVPPGAAPEAAPGAAPEKRNNATRRVAGPAVPGLRRLNATRRLPGAPLPPPPPPPAEGGPALPAAAAPTAAGEYPPAQELGKMLNLNPVPILFNVKNGNFKVTIPRARGTRGSLEICSPSLKGIRDKVVEDFNSGSAGKSKSTFGKFFGRAAVEPRARRSRRSRRQRSN